MSRFQKTVEKQDAGAARKALEQCKDPEAAMAEALRSAIGAGDETAVRFILDTFHPPIPAWALHFALLSRNSAILRMLVEHGGDVNVRDGSDLLTPMHGASYQADTWGIRALAECGADVNSRDAYGRTPLMALAASIHAIGIQKDILAMVRSMGATIAGDQGDGQPIEALGLLLELRADASLTDCYGNDAIMHYETDIARSDAEPDPGVLAVLAGAGAPGSGPTGRLFEAIRANDLSGACEAIAEGADLNRVNPAPVGMTPLIAAGGSAEMVRILLDAGADPNRPGLTTTPLVSAAFTGNLPVVKQLVAAGADIEALEPGTEDDGSVRRNAYLAAELNRKPEVVEYLRALGSARPRPRASAMLKAGVGNWEDFCELLVKADAETAAKALAEMIGGQVYPDAYGRSFEPGAQAYVLAQPKGMRWCNVFQVAPSPKRYEGQEIAERLGRELAARCRTSVLWVAYNDTAGAAAFERYEPDGSVDSGWDTEDSMARLEALAVEDKFVVGTLGAYCAPGKECDVEFLGYPAEAFDGVAFVSD